ncbi:MAG: V-type ATP synthase subunit D [Chlamydiales bacterium]|nr:V-type ATP synthase subunit D [Chlamydiales bacterium]
MAEVKLTKNELRSQQVRLNQLEKYLPTLQVKKAMLQTQVNEARSEILRLEEHFHEARLTATHSGGLLNQRVGLDLTMAAKVKKVDKEYENIAGVEIPIYKGIEFEPFEYPLFSTPAWLDAAVTELREMAIARVKVLIGKEKKAALEKELREVSIRVNLFEKNLIPKAKRDIKRIKVFLGDQELAAVGQAKVAKAKIEKRKHANRRD